MLWFLRSAPSTSSGDSKRRWSIIKGSPIYRPRLCQTIAFRLSSAEHRFYDSATDYLKWSYENNRTSNKNAAAMVVAVLQRRLASSTYAMLESLKRRRQRVLDSVSGQGPAQPSLERITAYFDTSTADEYDQGGDGYETEESVENQALSLARPTNAAQLQKELGVHRPGDVTRRSGP